MSTWTFIVVAAVLMSSLNCATAYNVHGNVNEPLHIEDSKVVQSYVHLLRYYSFQTAHSKQHKMKYRQIYTVNISVNRCEQDSKARH